MFACVVLGVALGMVVGCAGAPVQKPTQTIAPDTATAAKLDQVSAAVLSLCAAEHGDHQRRAEVGPGRRSVPDADRRSGFQPEPVSTAG